MPVVRLSDLTTGPTLAVVPPGGRTLDVPAARLGCLLWLPGRKGPVDAIIDTGAALTFVPEGVWQPLQPGVDFEWLPFAPGTPPPTGRFVNRSFSYRMARLLAPVTVMDYSTTVDRPDVIVAFADGNPSVVGQKLPAVVVGLWGGLLEGSRLRLDRDPAAGRPTGSLVYP